MVAFKDNTGLKFKLTTRAFKYDGVYMVNRKWKVKPTNALLYTYEEISKKIWVYERGLN